MGKSETRSVETVYDIVEGLSYKFASIVVFLTMLHISASHTRLY